MVWFRSLRRCGGWLALLALTLQLGLAFGHVHGTHAAGSQAAAVTSTPSPTDNGDHDDDYCATCAILALLTASPTASAPVAPAPVAFVAAEIAIPDASIRIGLSRAAFHSRAPPLS